MTSFSDDVTNYVKMHENDSECFQSQHKRNDFMLEYFLVLGIYWVINSALVTTYQCYFRNFNYIKCSKCPPLAVMHILHRSNTLRQIRRHRSLSLLISENFCRIASSSWWLSSNCCDLKSSFISPHKEKSHGVRSGERGGHATVPERPIQRLKRLSKNSASLNLQNSSLD